LLTGKPVKAFIEQNHEAHIQTHMSAMQNPKIMQLLAMNPQAPALQAAMMAHINEHIAFEYRKQVEMAIGAPLPGEEQNKHMAPEMADQIAMATAKASQQLMQQAQQQASQQQAQQQMQDPVVQMQMQELQLKQQDLQLKAQKQAADMAAKADQIRIEESRIQAQKDIAAMQVGATAAAKKDQLDRQQQADGLRMGIDAAKHKAQMAVQMAQRNSQKQSPKRGDR
jgi:hypothetical protein